MRSLLIAAVAVACLSRDAHACKPFGQAPHTIDASMQATDHTPPTLPAIPPAQLHFGDDSSQGCGSDCADTGIIRIPAVATDDLTTPDKIGYRFTLESGDLAPGLTLPATAVDRNTTDAVNLYWNSTTGRPVDFTLTVVAVDLAGNESAPQTVRVMDDTSHACAVARARTPGPEVAGLALLALMAIACRRR